MKASLIQIQEETDKTKKMLFYQTLDVQKKKRKKNKKQKKVKDNKKKFKRQSGDAIEMRMFEKHEKYAKYRRNGKIFVVTLAVFYGICYSLSAISS